MGSSRSRSSRGKTAVPSGRRGDILHAALDCFTRLGFASTTMDDIRQQSRASTGSLYHHFPGKEQLAAALYVTGLRDYQAGFVSALGKKRSARAAVRQMIDYHLGWVRTRPDWARYLLDMGRHADLVATTRAEVEQMNREFIATVLDWLEPHFDAGSLRRLAPTLLFALILGPAQYVARQWLSGRPDLDLDDTIATLSEAAWRALGGATEP